MLWNQSQRLWYLLPITLTIHAFFFFLLHWFGLIFHVWSLWLIIYLYGALRCSISLDTGNLYIFYSNSRVLHVFKLNQISSTRSVEDVVICVRWEMSFGRERGKTQTDLQHNRSYETGQQQLSSLRPSWVLNMAPVCRRALISEETSAFGTSLYSSLTPAWRKGTAKVYTWELTWEPRPSHCWQHSHLTHLLMSFCAFLSRLQQFSSIWNLMHCFYWEPGSRIFLDTTLLIKVNKYWILFANINIEKSVC